MFYILFNLYGCTQRLALCPAGVLRTPRSGSPDEGWWAGLDTIPVLSRERQRRFDGTNFKPR
ncbi:MAG TPA: hypothetical protein VFG81_03835 [Anaerolineales bacterium]|nr:hypothetical protein [Anaerolineales bacterium]